MFPNTDEALHLKYESPEPYTILLGVKEFSLLSIIFFFGFCGFSLCSEIVNMDQLPAEEIDNILIHDMPLSSVTYDSHHSYHLIE